jgi:hypothetical protein
MFMIKLKEFITIKAESLKILKGIINTDEELKHNHENMGKNSHAKK